VVTNYEKELLEYQRPCSHWK